MFWTEPEFYGPTGGLVAISTALGYLRKAGKFPFNGNPRTTGNGAKAVKEHVKVTHAAIDAKLLKHDTEFIDLGKIQIEQNLLIKSNTTRMAEDRKYHGKRFDEGREQFQKLFDAIGGVRVDVGVLASREKNGRSNDP